MLVRAMVLTDFRCPPMPLVGQRFSGGEETVINSHDLMAAFMAQSFKMPDEGRNAARRCAQVQLRDQYLADLGAELRKEGGASFEEVYGIMARHTRDYMGTYLMGTVFSAQDLRVLPPDYITPRLAQEIDHYGRALRIMADSRRPLASREDAERTAAAMEGVRTGEEERAAVVIAAGTQGPSLRLPANNGGDAAIGGGGQNVTEALLMRCARCAVDHEEQGVVHEPVLKRMRRGVGAE